MSEPTKSGNKLSQTQVILIIGFALIIIAIAAVGFLFSSRSNSNTPLPTAAPGSGNVVLDEGNAKNAIAELNRKVKEGQFEVKMNSTWNFPDGTSPSTDAYAANSEANRLPIYFEVALDNDEVIYTSPEIPVGSAVKDIVLEKDLDAGDYECICTYHLLNEDKTIRSSVSVVVRLHIAA